MYYSVLEYIFCDFAEYMRNIILVAIIVIIIYNLVLFGSSGGIGNGIFFLLLNLFYFLFKKSNAKNTGLATVASILSVVFGFLMGLHANEIVQNINFFTAIFLSTAALYYHKSEHDFNFKIFQFIIIPLVVAKSTISSLLSFRKEEEPGKISDIRSTTSIIKGISISLPVLAVLVVLLTNADPVFGKIIEDIFDDLWQRLIVSAILFIGLVGFGVTKIYELNTQSSNEDKSAGKNIELLIICGSVATLLGSFLIVQFQYFFSNIGERELQQLGIASLTYSEYVRKGFFELLAASVVCFVVAVYAIRHIHSFEKIEKIWLQIASSALVVEIFLLILSAMQRVNLYSQTHGLTRARAMGFIFLVWLTMILAIFLFGIVKSISKKYLFWAVNTTMLFILLNMNIINIDGLIATKYRPSVNNEIDYYYIANLSSDAVNAWEETILESGKTIEKVEKSNTITDEEYRQYYWSRETLLRLNEKVTYLQDRMQKRKWASYNWSEYQAFDALSKNQQIFDTLPKLLEKTEFILNNKLPDNLRYSIPLDRSSEPPLI